MAGHSAANEHAQRPSVRHAAWHWATSEAQTVLATRYLAAILRFHRRVNGQSRSETGTLIGYDKTYVSAPHAASARSRSTVRTTARSGSPRRSRSPVCQGAR